jgi:heme exporter protein D
MAFSSFSDFIDMGGHGFYVWLAFLVSILLLIYLLYWPIFKSRRSLAEISQQLKREQNRRSQFSPTGKN